MRKLTPPAILLIIAISIFAVMLMWVSYLDHKMPVSEERIRADLVIEIADFNPDSVRLDKLVEMIEGWGLEVSRIEINGPKKPITVSLPSHRVADGN